MPAIDTSLPLSQFRVLTMLWMGDDGSVDTAIVHHSDVAAMVAAKTRLHHSPGVNPYNGVRTKVLAQIRVAGFEARGPFWHTRSDLSGEGPGAIEFEGSYGEVIWENPEYTAMMDADQQAMLEVEMAA